MAETVYSPVEDYSGTVAGVPFTDGKGSTDDGAALAYFRRHGYGVGSKPKPGEPEPTEPVEPVVAVSTLHDAAEKASDAGPPARSASKADWVDFAVASGVARDDAEAMTRDELAALPSSNEGE